MDWSKSEMQLAIEELGGSILSEASQPWESLKESELLGLQDFLSLTALLVEVGKTGARVPLFATEILGAPIGHFSEAGPAGEVLTGGLLEADSRDPRAPQTRAEGGKLYGTRICVPAVDKAERIVVSAQDGVYAARLSDCRVEAQIGTDDDPLGEVHMDGTPAQRLGGDEVLDWWLPRIDVGVCAVLLGLSQTALQMTAEYLAERQQFGRPIGSFQAVQQRAADAWILTQVMEVSLWQAVWRVSEGIDSDRERAIARYWASEGSHTICASAQHLHGGFGFDRDYPLHRFFLAAKQHELILGGANAQLARLGGLLAAR